jgi:hypothetical protein
MNRIDDRMIKELFKNLCCSRCRNDFTKESLTIKEQERDILICNLKCLICEKDFGDVVLNINPKSDRHASLEIIDGPAPINSDDVIDAHNFIKKMK